MLTQCVSLFLFLCATNANVASVLIVAVAVVVCIWLLFSFLAQFHVVLCFSTILSS